ncbi:MAG: ribonucleotide reductase subunit alpha [Burkholderiales bacterium RIFOXYD12_FULL_59_19]|nr:MAG: ribonucleotide reductase subunit alpha [Burkholderiales bacterium RIFOXYD12_FULL_59_19]
MTISNFDDLLQAARQQAQPQRLLMVFACAELPDDCTPEQRREFESGGGGALVPAMCADKTPEEIQSFATLKLESGQFQSQWHVVFVAALSGAINTPPSSSDIEQTLDRMVESIKLGALANMIAFDTSGSAITLE